jgi:hypothetical protein
MRERDENMLRTFVGKPAVKGILERLGCIQKERLDL